MVANISVNPDGAAGSIRLLPYRTPLVTCCRMISHGEVLLINDLWCFSRSSGGCARTSTLGLPEQVCYQWKATQFWAIADPELIDYCDRVIGLIWFDLTMGETMLCVSNGQNPLGPSGGENRSPTTQRLRAAETIEWDNVPFMNLSLE